MFNIDYIRPFRLVQILQITRLSTQPKIHRLELFRTYNNKNRKNESPPKLIKGNKIDIIFYIVMDFRYSCLNFSDDANYLFI